MTHAFLQAELASLISDSKRRFNEVRTAAEQSLADLKTIAVTSETQLAGDLLRRPQFVDPFILACKSKNAKLAGTGTVCLQRLTASKAISRTRLADVLDAFHDGVASGYEPQLKVLQTLPSLLQLYANDLYGDLLARTLEICAALQSSKSAIVSNTAAATFQQLVSTVFEKAGVGDNSQTSPQEDVEGFEAGEEHHGVSLDDAIRLFEDFCLLLDQQRPQFLKVESLPNSFLLETLQAIFSTHDSFVISNIDQNRECWKHLAQGISRVLAKKDGFGTTVRALSIVLSIVQGHAEELRDLLLQLIPLSLNALEKDGNPQWKRALYLEFFRSICSDFSTVRELFDLFDNTRESEKVIGQLMSALVRIAAEDPSLIGLGRQSTIPVQRTTDLKSDEAASIEAQGLGGAITSVSSGDTSTIGISIEWSVISVRLMDQPDKHAAPTIPSTYLYTLVLGCISSFCDGLSKFVMPLSVPSRAPHRESLDGTRRDSSATDRTDGEVVRKSKRPSSSSQKYQRLINPLMLSKHPLLPKVQTCASMIEACWPAALATCSTFLNSALDSEFYHVLIRSVQKLAQVSGVLELTTPRDALLTTLAKASIPTNASSIISAYRNSRTNRAVGSEPVNPNDDIKSPTEQTPTPTFQISSSPLNIRHLLCLRALLNLGIALGPTLEQDAWFILIETMQTVEALLAIPTTIAASSHSGSPRMGAGGETQTTLASEIAAVQAATKRMLESTRGYSSEAFAVPIQALLRLLGQADAGDDAGPSQESLASPTSPTRLGAPRTAHEPSRSISGLWTKSKTLELEAGFVLNKISDLARINIDRFASISEHACSWDLIGVRLLRLSQDTLLAGNHRIQSASILDLISMETMKLLDDIHLEPEETDMIRSRCLQSLLRQLESSDRTQNDKFDSIELEIHKRLLEALESMLSHSGESLSSGWTMALEILSISFAKRGGGQPKLSNATIEQADHDEQTAQILRAAFRSIQLIASDFLRVLDASSLASLAQLLRSFGSQWYDLNAALTSTTLLWSLASQVLTRIETIDFTTMPASETDREVYDTGLGTPAPATLWGIVLLQLIHLCKDERPDVRNAAIRVLLKMLDASSEFLSSNAWATTLVSGPLSTIRFCITQYGATENDHSEWMVSAAQLTDGIVHLISQDLKVIAEHDDFKKTWLYIMDVLKDILGTMSLSASSLAFSNLSRLLSALPMSGNVDEELVAPAMDLWATYHPSEIQQPQPNARPSGASPNQLAFTSHAHVLLEAYKTSPAAVSKYRLGETSLLMHSLERTILLCTHPPYSSDVKTLSTEQKEVSDCLAILKILLRDAVAEYSQYILRLLEVTLSIRDGKVESQVRKSAISKAVQKPTFIAFASACLDNFRDLILEYANDDMFIQTLAVQEALQTLSPLIRTKYTQLPSNSQAPLWRNATVTVVAILEALRKYVTSKKAQNCLSKLGILATHINSAAVSVLDPGGLSSSPTTQSEEIIQEGESFDIKHFELLHKAIIPVLRNAAIGEDVCKQYAISLFKASLLAKPWFSDIPSDLTNGPLKGLMEVRPGSVHRPVFAVRRRICYTALDTLFELVQREPSPTEIGNEHEDVDWTMGSHKLARAACPYLVLRVVHPLKTFLADQRLRGLTPPLIPQQVELQVVLTKYVDLRSDDDAFRKMTATWRDQNGPRPAWPTDGKSHLHILYPLYLRMDKFWRELPRLKGEGAWQDGEPGRAIEDALERWSVSVGEGWGL